MNIRICFSIILILSSYIAKTSQDYLPSAAAQATICALVRQSSADNLERMNSSLRVNYSSSESCASFSSVTPESSAVGSLVALQPVSVVTVSSLNPNKVYVPVIVSHRYYGSDRGQTLGSNLPSELEYGTNVDNSNDKNIGQLSEVEDCSSSVQKDVNNKISTHFRMICCCEECCFLDFLHFQKKNCCSCCCCCSAQARKSCFSFWCL